MLLATQVKRLHGDEEAAEHFSRDLTQFNSSTLNRSRLERMLKQKVTGQTYGQGMFTPSMSRPSGIWLVANNDATSTSTATRAPNETASETRLLLLQAALVGHKRLRIDDMLDVIPPS